MAADGEGIKKFVEYFDVQVSKIVRLFSGGVNGITWFISTVISELWLFV